MSEITIRKFTLDIANDFRNCEPPMHGQTALKRLIRVLGCPPSITFLNVVRYI